MEFVILPLLPQEPTGPAAEHDCSAPLTSCRDLSPDDFVRSTQFRCDDNVVLISNFGVVPGRQRRPSISINGQPVAGAARFLHDLRGHEFGVFNFFASCQQQGPEIYIRVYYSQPMSDGTILVQQASATIDNGNITDYRPMSDTSFESFW